jgi:hypothetical protein
MNTTHKHHIYGETISNKYSNTDTLLHHLKFRKCKEKCTGQDSVGGRATGYGLDGPGIEFQCFSGILYHFRPALCLMHLPIQWLSVLCPEVRRPGPSTISPI